MSALDLERIEALMLSLKKELLQDLVERGAKPLPALLTLQAAAAELSVGVTALRQLVSAHVVLAVPLGRRVMVPRSEVERLSRVDRPKVTLTGKAKRKAAELAQVREPVPGAKAAALQVRAAKRRR